MTEILLIRHPETDLAGTFCGHSDPPLNAAGRAQLAKLLDELRGEALETVYTSDLARAVTLGQAIAADHGIACVVRGALREMFFGDWEGLTWAQIEDRDPAEAAAWLANYPRQAMPHGEAFADFEQRVLAEFDRVVQGSQQRIALVAHAGVLRSVLIHRAGFDEPTAWSATKNYCSVVRFKPVPAGATA